jgi:ABC-2 type transport system permease protein
MKSALTGTIELARLGLRRDRLMIPIWVYALAAAAISTAYSFRGLYNTPGVRREFAAGVESNASTLALYGHVYSPSTVGGLTAWRMLGIGVALASVLSVLLVIRHTRMDEEAGRLELIGAGGVGRAAPLAAALLIAVLSEAALALLVVVGLVAVGQPTVGSAAFALAWFGGGAVFAAVAAVSAQLAQSARQATGLALSVLGVAYLLRAIGDVGPGWLSWASPVGWAQQVRPFASNRWWPLALSLVSASLISTSAFAMSSRRDLGAGMLPQRPAPPAASPALRSAMALAWRLHRGAVALWTVGLAIYGAAIGGIADGVGALVNSSPGTRNLILKMGGRGGLVDAFLATSMGVLGFAVAAYVVQSLMLMRNEETAQRAEPVLAAAVSRAGWVRAHVVVTAAGSAIIVLAAGLAAGLTHGARTHDMGGQVPRVVAAAIVQLPAAWVLGGAVVLMYGAAARALSGAWGLLGVCLLLGQLGPVLNLPNWAMDISPFTHLPKLPGNPVDSPVLVALLLIVVALGGLGFSAFARRDIG